MNLETIRKAGDAVRFLARLARVLDIRRGPDGQMEITIKSSVDLTVEGELNVMVPADLNVDTLGAKLRLNSKMARQIRDLPSSVEYRRASVETARKQLKNGLYLSNPAVPVESCECGAEGEGA